MFEYVTKAEYKPVKQELEKIIVQVQAVMRKKYETTFQFSLIGSGKRHLVTRVVGGNSGYDFDYNLIIAAPKQGYHYKADVVKQQFRPTKNKKYYCVKFRFLIFIHIF